MPKLKTRRSANKRYKKTAQGKYIRKSAFKGHLLGRKSSKRKRNLSRQVKVNAADFLAVKKMLPY